MNGRSTFGELKTSLWEPFMGCPHSSLVTRTPAVVWRGRDEEGGNGGGRWREEEGGGGMRGGG